MKQFLMAALLAFALVFAGCTNNGGNTGLTPTPQTIIVTVTVTPVPTATLAPTPTPVPTATPEVSPNPTSNPTATPIPTERPPAVVRDKIDNLSMAVQDAINIVLANNSAVKSITLNRLVNVYGPYLEKRPYYEGGIITSTTEDGQSKFINVHVQVKGIYPGEAISPLVSPTTSRQIAGRTMGVYTNGEIYETSLKCYSEEYYIYLKKEGDSDILPDTFFEKLAAACPV